MRQQWIATCLIAALATTANAGEILKLQTGEISIHNLGKMQVSPLMADVGQTQDFIIQFKNVKIQYKIGKSTYTEMMTQHTAIIYEVNSSDEVVLIHQNTGYAGRKVATSKMKFSTIVKGSYKIYRPVKN